MKNRAHSANDDGIRALIEAAREVRRVRDAQGAYTRQLQKLAAEARATGKSQSHRMPAPVVHDYGNCIAALLEALQKVERSSAPSSGTDAPQPAPTSEATEDAKE